MNTFLSLTGLGLGLLLIQVLAAVPWLTTLAQGDPRDLFRAGGLRRAAVILLATLGIGLVLVAGGVAVLTALPQSHDTLWAAGVVYGSLLHLQLALDVVVIAFAVVLAAWPKGGAVALAAFRESARQFIFWLFLLAGVVFMTGSVFLPYFTFGEDHKMMEELGYDGIMLLGVLFGCLTASMSISEEIEGRTAITLMSKPVSRRQFLLGKFLGILFAIALMAALLGWAFNWFLLLKYWFDGAHWFDKITPVPIPHPFMPAMAAWHGPRPAFDFLTGVEFWGVTLGTTLPGVLLATSHAMILLALAVSLATRLPMAVNLVVCLGVYLLGHLTPVLVQIAQTQADLSEPVRQMLSFMAQLFDAVLPNFGFFSVETALVRDVAPPPGEYALYVGSVALYGLVYTAILLIVGLILFEDRDLA
jgi:ABC-type transport system involved in multi-copper enzyme maturation permease subunit